MRLMYIMNNSQSGSPYCNIMGWCGLMLEFESAHRILVQCDKPDDTLVGCLVKGVLEIDIDAAMLEAEMGRILHVRFSYGETWAFLLEDFELKPIICAMLDMAYGESGVTEKEFLDYAEMYRSKEAQPD